MARVDRDTMFLEIARLISERSTCERAHVGAVIVKDGRIISTGYNGAPPGMPHCEEVGCEADTVEVNHPELELEDNRYTIEGCVRTIHAEANAIAWASRAGLPVEGATMYCTHAPCYNCAKLMLSAGIACMHYDIAYRDTRGVELLSQTLKGVTAHAAT